METIIPRKKFTSAEKIKIKKDWLALLPEIAIKPKVNYMELGRMVGPMLITIILSTKHQWLTYKVGYITYDLIIDQCVGGFEIALESDRHISLEEHDSKHLIHAQLIKEKALLPLEGPISLDDIFNAYVKKATNRYKQYQENYEDSVKMLTETHDGDEKRARLMLEYGLLGPLQAATPALIAAWAGEPKKAQEWAEWACRVYNIRDLEFRKNLMEEINNPEMLRAKARANRIKYKMDYAPYQDIVGVPYKETWSD